MASRESRSQRAAAAAAAAGWKRASDFSRRPRQKPFFPIQISLAMEMYGQWKLQEPPGRRFEAGPSLCLRRSRSIGRPLRRERQLLAFVKQKSRDTYRALLFSFVFLWEASVLFKFSSRYFLVRRCAAFFTHVCLHSLIIFLIIFEKRLVEPFQSAGIHLGSL